MADGSRTTDFYGDQLTAARPAVAVWHGRIMTDNVKQYSPVRKLVHAAPQVILDAPEAINYEMHFTRDKELIAEYKNLRKQLYGIDPHFVGFRALTDDYIENCEDDDNQMLIIHDGKRVYGGASLRISTPKKPVMLYLEQDVAPPKGKFYFSLREDMPELELDKYACAEFDELVLHPSIRNGDHIKAVCQAVLDRCIDHRVRYMFGSGDKVRSRLYIRVYRSLSLKADIHKGLDIPLRPEHENIKRYVLFGDMKNFHAVPSDPDATSLLQPIEEYEFY